MATPESHLEKLPTELKIKLMKFSSDPHTLINLFQAFSAYHKVYAANCDAILTSVTFRELEHRSMDILKPTPFAQIRIWQNKNVELLKDTIISAREQSQAGKALRLKAKGCIALLCLIEWKVPQVTVDSSGGHKAVWESTAGCRKGEPFNFGSFGTQHHYYTLNFGPYSSIEVDNMRFEADRTEENQGDLNAYARHSLRFGDY